MKKLQLLVTSPCSKQWDDLLPTTAGRYCNSCEKHIVDLSAKSDAELIAFFKSKKENVCAKLDADQLHRELTVPQTKGSWKWMYPFALGAILSGPAQASELKPLIAQSAVPLHRERNSFEAKANVAEKAITISGTITDKLSGKALHGVKIRKKGNDIVLALSDSLGKFQLELAQGISVTPFTFEHNGYELTEMLLTLDMDVKLDRQRAIMLGGVSVISLNKESLYVIYAGKKSCNLPASRLNEILPDWIEKVEILKDANATTLYGSKAANGAVLIGIKKAFANKIDFSKK